MKTMNDLKNLDVSMLELEAKGLRQELFNLKLSKLTGQVKDTSQYKKLRIAVARVNTVLTMKRTLLAASTNAKA